MAKHLIYGPVPSRRLGYSLGVDLVPFKICSYNCIYCQIGPTAETTVDRQPYITAEKILPQLLERLNEGIVPDYITLGGSGEPTLNSELANIIKAIKAHTDIPVAVLTNGSLLMDDAVRNDLCQADVVLPSFDAFDPSTFARINRPHHHLKFEDIAAGLIEFRKIYSGEIWLEIFLVEGVNATEAFMKQFKLWTDQFQADKIHLNTAVRPTAEKGIGIVAEEKLEAFCKILGPNAEVIASFNKHAIGEKSVDAEKEILSMLSRRPCTLADISAGLGGHPNEVLKFLASLVSSQQIEMVTINGKQFYQKKVAVSKDKL